MADFSSVFRNSKAEKIVFDGYQVHAICVFKEKAICSFPFQIETEFRIRNAMKEIQINLNRNSA
jgi:hypothetical protein